MSISQNIGTTKTIRGYLAGLPEGSTVKLNNDTVLTDVDLTWDGDSYYIISKVEVATETGTVSTISIYNLDGVLPITVTTPPATTTTE